MAQPHARSGQVVSVLPLGDQLASTKTTAILKAEQLEVMRIVLLAGKEMPEHSTPGEVTLQCIEGRLELRTPGGTSVLEPGDFTHLAREAPHSLKAISNASALLTIRL